MSAPEHRGGADRRQEPRREAERSLHYAQEVLTSAALAASEALGHMPGYPSLVKLHEAAAAFRAARDVAYGDTGG